MSMGTLGLLGLRLPFVFDPVLLKRDLAGVLPEEWTPHYNSHDFGGSWKGVALRSPAGLQTDITAGNPGLREFADTPLLERCPHFREVLAQFRCTLKAVRLLSLEPGSFIREHSDNALDYEDGEVRIHVPIETNAGVEFYVCGERLLFEEGQCYYVNVNMPHRVNNRGSAARVHLVIDAEVDEWLRGVFERGMEGGGEIPRSPLPPGGFEEFADRVFADVSLREKLRGIPDEPGLLRAAVEAAAGLGFDLNEADLGAVARSRASAVRHDTEGWIPVDIHLRDGQPWAKWIYAPGHRFAESFFEDSIRKCLHQPFTRLFRREMPLTAGAGVRPDGLIFHMSRCGSTLVSRSLAAAESTLVVSEAPPVDQIVQLGRPEWLQWIVSALGQGRPSGETRFLVKLDAWHIRSLPLFRAAFPDVPWIFVYRDPLEVLVSQLRKPGLQAIPGFMDPAILGMRREDATLGRQQWCSGVIGGFLSSAQDYRGEPMGMFVNYRDLPGAICGRIAGHFGLCVGHEDEARIRAAGSVDAKNPWGPFEPDTEIKQKEAGLLVGDRWLERLVGLYREMELRNSVG